MDFVAVVVVGCLCDLLTNKQKLEAREKEKME